MATLEDKLNAISSGKQEKPLMVDESFLPEGTVSFPELKKGEGTPYPGLKLNAAGVPEAKNLALSTSFDVQDKKDIPVDEPRLQELKQMFSTQQTIQEPVQQPEAPLREPSSDSSWSDLLPALAPLITEALAGGGESGGVSYGISGNYLMKGLDEKKARANKLEDRLYELQKAKQLAMIKASNKGSSKQFQSKNVYDIETGKTYFINYDTSIGAYTYPDGSLVPQEKLRTGFAIVPEESDRRTDYKSKTKRSDADYLGSNTKVNPQTGELEVIRSGVSTPIQTGQPKQEFNKKQQGDVSEMVSDFTKSPAYQDSVNSLSIAPTVTSLLNSAQRTNNPNSIAGESVVLTMIRQAQKVGVASDRDAAAMGGTEQWEESVNRIRQKLLGQGGPLTIRDIQELREISEIYKKRSQSLLNSHYADSKKSYSKRYGFSNEQIDGQLGSKVNPYMTQSDKEIRSDSLPEGIDFGGIKRFPPKENPNATVPLDIGGKLHWTEPSEWENVKKQYPKAKRLKK